MAKHTPGPWMIDRDGLYGSAEIRTDDRRICKLLRYHGNGDVEANARLISAAPARLEACEAFVSLAATNFVDWESEIIALKEKSILAQAAIAAARPAPEPVEEGER